MSAQMINGTKQITEQQAFDMVTDTTPTPRYRNKRLTAPQAYKLAGWLKENIEDILKTKPALNRVRIAEKAAKEMGFNVTSSMIETAELTIGERTIPLPTRTYPKASDYESMRRRLDEMEKRMEVMDKILREFV